jgi:hypothetical protein
MGLIPGLAALEDFAYLPYRFTRVDEYERPKLEASLAPFVKIHESNLLTRSIKLLIKDIDTQPMIQRAHMLSETALAS